jgi:hypothetical protein
MRTCREDCEAAPPVSALRPGFREVSDRAKRKRVCCQRDFLVVWTIVLDWRRREPESLYDRALCRRLRALYLAARHLFSSGIVARVGRARVFRRPRGAYTRRASRNSPRVSCYAPMRPPPHPRAPSQLATLRADRCAEFSARWRERARSSRRASSTQSDRDIQLEGVRPRPRASRDPTRLLNDARGGSERSRRRSPCA